MAAPRAVYDSSDDIPETIEWKSLFAQKGDRWELTGVEGVKTEADVQRLQTSLHKAQQDYKEARDKLKAWDGWDQEDVQSRLDRMEELEAAASNKLDEAKLDELANKRAEGILKTKLLPLERSIRDLTKERDEFKGQFEELSAKDRRRKIRDALRQAAVDAKVREEAVDDVLDIGERYFQLTEEGAIITGEGNGLPPGLDPKSWLQDLQPRKPHWWPATIGGGAIGGRPGLGGLGPNPFSHENWNMTEQGRLVKEDRAKGTNRADQLARAAGTTVGGRRPNARK